MVGTVIHRYNPRLDYCSNPLQYRRWKRRFLAEVGQSARKHLRYRADISEYSIADADWLRRFFPDLPAVEGNLQEAMSTCRLVVLDHPGTVLAEALAANIPTICFWDKTQWLISPQAQPMFDKLAQAGILFDQPEAAAAQLNTIFQNVEAWWAEPGLQRARAEWCHLFARADGYWLEKWLKAFAIL